MLLHLCENAECFCVQMGVQMKFGVVAASLCTHELCMAVANGWRRTVVESLISSGTFPVEVQHGLRLGLSHKSWWRTEPPVENLDPEWRVIRSLIDSNKPCWFLHKVNVEWGGMQVEGKFFSLSFKIFQFWYLEILFVKTWMFNQCLTVILMARFWGSNHPQCAPPAPKWWPSSPCGDGMPACYWVTTARRPKLGGVNHVQRGPWNLVVSAGGCPGKRQMTGKTSMSVLPVCRVGTFHSRIQPASSHVVLLYHWLGRGAMWATSAILAQSAERNTHGFRLCSEWLPRFVSIYPWRPKMVAFVCV